MVSGPPPYAAPPDRLLLGEEGATIDPEKFADLISRLLARSAE